MDLENVPLIYIDDTENMDSFIKINGSGGSPPQYFNITDLYGHGYKNTSTLVTAYVQIDLIMKVIS